MKIIKNYLYNVANQLIVLIIPLITVPYISRVLGSEGVGINAFTNSIIQYFILAGSIGINLYGNRTIAYYRDNRKKMSNTFWEIAFLRLFCITLSYSVFLIFLLFVDRYQTFYLYQSLLIIAAGFDISWFFMGIEDFKKTVLRNIFVKLLSLCSIFIFVKEQNDVGIYILILSISMLVGNLTLWPYLKKAVQPPEFKQLRFKHHLRPAFALFVPQIATQVYLVLNKTMLGVFTGVVSAGYYDNTDKIVKMLLAIITATGTVMLPRMANTFAKGNTDQVKKYLYASFDFVSAISFPMAFGLAAVAPTFSVWFLGDEFAITGTLIPMMSLIIVFIGWSNVIGTQYLLPTNQTKFYSSSVIIGSIINFIMNIVLIPTIGVYGAVIATVVSEFAVTGVQLYYVRTTVSVQELLSKKWIYLIASLLMYVVVRYLNGILKAGIISFGIQIGIGMIIYFILLSVLKAPIIQLAKQFICK